MIAHPGPHRCPLCGSPQPLGIDWQPSGVCDDCLRPYYVGQVANRIERQLATHRRFLRRYRWGFVAAAGWGLLIVLVLSWL